MSVDTPQSRAAAAYNAAADYYDAAALSFWDRFGRRTVERIALRDGDRVLDVCCGSGSSALPAAERVGPTGYVLGVDLADRLLAQARTKAQGRGLANTEFRLGDLATLDGITQTFDAVICVFGIFFCPDMVGAVTRLWSVVRPGGVLAVTTWGARPFEPASSIFWRAVQSEAPALYHAFHPWNRIAEPAQLRALFDEAGVPTVELEVETGMHTLRAPEDWWTIVLGSGYRGTVERLSTETQQRVREYTLGRLRLHEVRTIEANVLYATARRARGLLPLQLQGAVGGSSAVIYFEDFRVGQQRVIGTYVIPKDEAIEFARKWEPQAYHLDDAAAETSSRGGLTVCSLYLFAVCTRLFFQQDNQIAVTAMLGKDEVRLPKPARPEDTLTYYTECVAKRSSRSRPDSGIVTLLDTLHNAAGETVLTQKVTLLVSRRGSAD
jgi:ubiquinone/menaquinone biosynthesis C-methylase UbiE/acyl dehydratase